MQDRVGVVVQVPRTALGAGAPLHYAQATRSKIEAEQGEHWRMGSWYGSLNIPLSHLI